ncbi:Double-stranded RNA-specific editase Adar-like isoform X2 [Aphelenchoides bicaudatus]|nr:Double-stranded RNA-specific editase Adar-like isoform X2 [Aphelenchoides bicaudatus]
MPRNTRTSKTAAFETPAEIVEISKQEKDEESGITDALEAMKILNNIPKDENGLPDTNFSKALNAVHDAFLNGNLSAGDEDKFVVQSAMPVICKYFGNKLPTFYIFQLPVSKADNLKFVCAVENQEEIVIGRQSISKAAAKASTALNLVYKLNLGETLNKKLNESAQKRQSDTQFSDYEPQAKRQNIEKQEYVYLDNENLSPSTKYYLTVNSKNAVQLLNETCSKKGLKTAVFDIVGEAKTGFVSTCKIEGYADAVGVSSDNKKQAKASSARVMLSNLIGEGLIAAPAALKIPTMLPQPNSFKDYVRNACYNMLIEAYNKNSISAIVDPKIAGCVMVNSVTREATLISWACGSYAGPTIYNNDGVVRDCDALVLCKRGLQKVLYRELVIYNQDRQSSIFYEDEKTTSRNYSQQLKLRPSITFHFFMNYVPKVDEHGKQTLSTKETHGMQKFSKKARIYLTMSTVDKIMKWNLVGVQGAVLASFVEPIYIKSLVIRGKFNRTAMEAALSTRIPPMQRLPSGYTQNVPILECDDQIHPSLELDVNYTPGERPAIVWNAVTEEYELLSCSSGFSLNGDALSVSRYGLCADIWTVWRSLRQEAPSDNYTDFKRTSANYNQTLRTFKENLVSNNLGLWAQK